MTYPSGAIVTYLRNANGQITQVDAKPTAIAAQVTIVDDVAYAPFGPITAVTYGNARVQSRTYDQNYGIDAITETGGTGGFTADYGLDAIGNVTAVTERGSLARDFAYDGQNRLKAMTNSGSNVESFEYDATGNRTKKTLAAAVSTYTIATTSHRLTNVSNQGTRLYDPAGNTTLVNTGAPAIYGYDERGRLRTVTLNATLQRTYKYNGKGERVLRIVEAGTTQSLQFVYDEAGHLLGEYTTAGSRVAEYVWLGDVLVGVLRSHDGSTYQFVETDHLGTPRAVINSINNAVIWRWDLTTTTFGDHQPANDPDGNAIAYGFNLRYPGQYYDGLEYVYYNYFRDYDSRTGRYLQSDPIGLLAGPSTYAYVLSNPLLDIDPHGLKPGDRFRRIEVAIGDARGWVDSQPIERQRAEWGGWLYKVGKCWRYTAIQGEDYDNMGRDRLLANKRTLPRTTVVALAGWHSHPRNSKGVYGAADLDISSGDVDWAEDQSVPFYLLRPDDKISRYDPVNNLQSGPTDMQSEEDCQCE